MWENISAAGSFGQFIVLLAATAFAVRQLRQLHRQNELQASLPYLAIGRTEEWRRARRAIDAIVADPVRDRPFDVREWEGEDSSSPLVWMGNFFNEIGALVQLRLIDGDEVLWSYRFAIIRAWDALLPLTSYYRTAGGYPEVWSGFEALMIRARALGPEAAATRMRELLPKHLREEFDRSNRAVLQYADRAAGPRPSRE